MVKYIDLSNEEKRAEYKRLNKEYIDYCNMGLALDLSRGKPNAELLDMSNGLLTVDISSAAYNREKGIDYRNYGMLDGIPEVKELFAEALGLKSEDIIIGGNSSLQIMHDTLVRAMLFGLYGSPRPWVQEKGLKWICVAPGYDRHFKITEALGFELLTVRMTETGPDMDEVERLVKDPLVKGIWCVPKYSNPTGNTYSDDTVRRLAAMECAAPDFRIMWDNAYAIHDFDEGGDTLLDIFAEAEKYGTRDRIMYFSSTSKVTFPGAGVAILAMSENNRRQTLPILGVQTISYDKLNSLRHLLYFENGENMRHHMLKLGEVIKGKFDITLRELEALRGLGIAEWTEPRGGYFISLDVMSGTAKRVFELMNNAGVTLTTVGATYPYGIDPEDKNLRIAPTYPSSSELELAVKILTLAVRLAALEKLMDI